MSGSSNSALTLTIVKALIGHWRTRFVCMCVCVCVGVCVCVCVYVKISKGTLCVFGEVESFKELFQLTTELT